MGGIGDVQPIMRNGEGEPRPVRQPPQPQEEMGGLLMGRGLRGCCAETRGNVGQVCSEQSLPSASLAWGSPSLGPSQVDQGWR